ncbi:MAG TPA: ribbon-helix-helix domain-containing protein [Candidatus Omnitrophota bacterium]|nr:ribbon-helix-helix domain-containing protein [Candidatus Omnitrophota bacterium]
MMKPITLKLEESQIKLLETVSKETHIPKSALIRQGIALIIKQHKEDIVSADLQTEIQALLKEDKTLLKRLA